MSQPRETCYIVLNPRPDVPEIDLPQMALYAPGRGVRMLVATHAPLREYIPWSEVSTMYESWTPVWGIETGYFFEPERNPI